MINYNIQKTKEQSLKYKKIKILNHNTNHTKYYTNQLNNVVYFRCFDENITNKSILCLTKLIFLQCYSIIITDRSIKYLTKLKDLVCYGIKITLKSKDKLKVINKVYK